MGHGRAWMVGGDAGFIDTSFSEWGWGRYDGKPVDLTSEQEAIATMYASMIKTDYATKKVHEAPPMPGATDTTRQYQDRLRHQQGEGTQA